MPTKDTKAIGVRVTIDDYERIMTRANRKRWSFNRWMNWAIKQGLRKHQTKEGTDV